TVLLVCSLPRSMVLPVEKQIHHAQPTQIAAAPRVEILIQLLRHPTDRALTHATPAEGVGVEGAHILGGQPASIHAARPALEIRRPGLQTVGHRWSKRLLSPAQLRHRQFQRPRLALHLFRFIAIAPPDALALTPAIVLSAQKRRRLSFDSHLQHVARKPTNEAHHRGFLRRRRGRRRALQQPVDLFLQPDTRWYSLHGVDLLRPRSNGAASGWLPGGYQRLFAFTGSLGHHRRSAIETLRHRDLLLPSQQKLGVSVSPWPTLSVTSDSSVSSLRA